MNDKVVDYEHTILTAVMESAYWNDWFVGEDELGFLNKKEARRLSERAIERLMEEWDATEFDLADLSFTEGDLMERPVQAMVDGSLVFMTLGELMVEVFKQAACDTVQEMSRMTDDIKDRLAEFDPDPVEEAKRSSVLEWLWARSDGLNHGDGCPECGGYVGAETFRDRVACWGTKQIEPENREEFQMNIHEVMLNPCRWHEQAPEE